jgi:Ca2+/Na+ antiporter
MRRPACPAGLGYVGPVSAEAITGVVLLAILVLFIGWSLDTRRKQRDPGEKEIEIPSPTGTTKSPEERKAFLAQAVTSWIRQGWRVESQSDYQAVLVKGHRPNHILHLLLSIFTLGLWLVVWIIVALAGGEKRRVINVDQYGNIHS